MDPNPYVLFWTSRVLGVVPALVKLDDFPENPYQFQLSGKQIPYKIANSTIFRDQNLKFVQTHLTIL